MLGLENFSFYELFRPFLLIWYVAIVVGYFYLIGPKRHRFKDSEPVRRKEKFLFVFGIVLLYLSVSGPLNVLSHMMFSAHMFQMAVAFLFAPPLILIGLPSWLVKPVFERRGMKWLLKVMHPLFTVVFFNAIFSFYHIPLIHDTVLSQYWLYRPYFILMLISAFMMWWPVATPVLQFRRLTELRRMGYIFACGVLLLPACALIIFSKTPMYATFTETDAWMMAMALCLPLNSSIDLAAFGGPEHFQLIPPLDDQQLGGVIMKLSQEIIFGAILLYTFNQWYRRENPEDGIVKNHTGEYVISEHSRTEITDLSKA